MNVETLDDLYAHRLAGLYSVETTLPETLDKLEEDATTASLDGEADDGLREALVEAVRSHRDETERHAERIETAFEAIQQDRTTRDVPAFDGLVDEKERFNNVVLNDELRPLYYLGFLMQLEQHEILAYESALTLAGALDVNAGATDPLEETLEEERAMFERLEALAESEETTRLLDAAETR
ncbi:ferritin-like domain-containing protein [Haloferacaceae archaeon DSL9]